MSISSIGGNISPLSALQTSNVSAINSATPTVDRDGDGGRVRGGGGGKFASALTQALAQLGISGTATTDSTGTSGTSATSSTSGNSSTSSTSDATSAQDPQQALAAFAQSLFAALQSQSSSGSSSTSSSSSDSGTDPSSAISGSGSGGHHHHGGGGISKLEGGIQNLIQQLSSSSTDTSDSTSTGTSTSGSSNSAIDALKQSFTNLLAADGQSGSSATLSSFLTNIEKNLQGVTPTGNVVSTKV
ncbi:hypothetical protein AAKU64_001495 [Undibacterium sp. GrIS 1.8]|uniref:hypothetical protein n=1 Tax=unclassified Undibacterium TaxID=2630295 RepID=UPI003397611B